MKAAILVSPAPVDGYPPVQNQARLLADAGYEVKILTSPLTFRGGDISFSHPRVRIYSLGSDSKSSRWLRACRYIAALARLRRSTHSLAVEIAYDPLGVLYSDLAYNRPDRRVAHFHECLQKFNTSWFESRLRHAAKYYQLISVPDGQRAQIVQSQLGLTVSPTVIPNYPMADTQFPPSSHRHNSDSSFSVTYCGSLGLHQKLDAIIQSVSHWPKKAKFRVFGNNKTAIGLVLMQQVAASGLKDRVLFEGWVDYPEMSRALLDSDLGILLLDPSYEQFRTALGASNKRYEYMRASLPQIGDMNPGVKELLEGQGIGTCVMSHDPVEIARVVTLYANDPARCRTEGARARALHLERYNYQAAFRPVLDWIEQAATEQASRHIAAGRSSA